MNTSNTDIRKYRETFQIGSFDTDLNGRAKLTSICNYFQEIAGHHVDLINQGIDDLKANNLAWILSRLKVQIFSTPKWKDNIDIETWSIGADGLFGNREYRIYNMKGDVIGQATSSWLVLNTKTKRLIRPQEIVAKMPINSEDPIFEHSLSKLQQIEQGNYVEDLHIHYSDLDFYQHVNNVKYIKWAIDSCLSEILLNKTIHELEINYLHEAKLDQILEIFNQSSDNTSKIVIKTKSTDIENCRVIIKWK
ncbi:thioesterase [Labilibaculum sp. K2S]|uniref:acyl-[acyl-carrier-protein] thioesterase n=1 Tax=Labilibaculum sp. K2S TaxID=3056386 RepID=UPI0025A4377E|nr:acyl-ACP thioesterase domain-containing protein [Labilibaculum sp. K2S]MDM8159798.1 thioesterase [Labilibaculum sp. K2S]